ncbi:hypothetical protein FRC00_002271 [Tulasnella sp. 408]|nr:hypothetical protein FRC00_002271 [Tulasnella sp. 408]
MLIFGFLTLIPAFLSLGANAAAIPKPVQSGDLVPRCNTCGDGPEVGNGIGAVIHTSIDVDAALKVFSHDHLTHASDIAGIFAHATGNVKAQVESVLDIATQVLPWPAADVAELNTALDAYIVGAVSTGADIFVKAGIDVAVFTTTDAACLKALIAICIQSDVQLATKVKADIILFVKNAIVVANTTCVDLQALIRVHVEALVNVTTSLHLDAKVATCASAAVAIKLALKAYIESCIASATGLIAVAIKLTLNTLCQIVDAWIANDFGVLSRLAVSLGIDLKVASDAEICKAIVAFLLKVNAKFNFVSAHGLDAALYAKVFSTVVAH